MTQPVAKDAAIYILDEHLQTHDRGEWRAKLAVIYQNAAPVPEDADEAVRIAEQTIFRANVADAAYHERQADHFRAAIKQIEGGE